VQVLHARMTSVAALVSATSAVPNSRVPVQLVRNWCWHKIVVLIPVLLLYAVLVPVSTILALTVHPILVSQTLCAIILSNAQMLIVVSVGVTKREQFQNSNSNFKFQISMNL